MDQISIKSPQPLRHGCIINKHMNLKHLLSYLKYLLVRWLNFALQNKKVNATSIREIANGTNIEVSVLEKEIVKISQQ